MSAWETACATTGIEALARKRVLIVEDNVDAAELLRDVLEIEGHEVVVAYTGPAGVDAARCFKPDVVLCDIGLPGMDGYAVARALRADDDPAIRTAFLVAVTGYAQAEDVTAAREAGFDRHVAKPPDLQALESMVAQAPAHSSSR